MLAFAHHIKRSVLHYGSLSWLNPHNRSIRRNVRWAGLQKLQRVLADRGTERLDPVLVLDDYLIRAVFAKENTIVIVC